MHQNAAAPTSRTSRKLGVSLKIVALLAVTTFVAWGGLHYLSPHPDLPGAEPSDTPISSREFVARTGIRLLLIVLALGSWYGTQSLIGAKAPADPAKFSEASLLLTQSDRLLRATEPLNQFLNAHPKWANGLLVVSSTIIDQLGVLVLWSGLIGPSIRPFVGLVLLFGLRQICQAVTALPPPRGIIWRNPGFPSIFVTYGVANDLFFSGHTALAVYGALEVAWFGQGWLTACACLIVLFEVGAVLLLRAHYTMDVFAGIVAAVLAAEVASRIGPLCDRALAWFW